MSPCSVSPSCLHILWVWLSCYKTRQKKGVRKKAFMLRTATGVLSLLWAHTSSLGNINIRWKFLSASTPCFLHCAQSSITIAVIEAVFKQKWGWTPVRELADTHLSHTPGSGAAESKRQAKLLQYTQNEWPRSHEQTSLSLCKSFRKHIFLDLCNTDQLVGLWETQQRWHLLRERAMFVLKEGFVLQLWRH